MWISGAISKGPFTFDASKPDASLGFASKTAQLEQRAIPHMHVQRNTRISHPVLSGPGVYNAIVALHKAHRE